MSPARSYRYTPRLAPMLLGGAFFGACTALYVSWALTNDRGLVINGLITLEVGGATAFYWVLAALSAGFVAIALASLARREAGARSLVLDDRSLTVPHRWSSGAQTVPYDAIRAVQRQEVNGQRFLTVTWTGGTVTIAAILLESNEQLDEIARELLARVPPRH